MVLPIGLWRRVAVIAIVTDGAWLSILLILVFGSDFAYQNGFWPIDPVLDGKKVIMKRGWVPVASSKSAIPPFDRHPGVSYFEVYGLLWGTPGTLVIRYFPQINEHDLMRAKRIEQFGWGRAYVLPNRRNFRIENTQFSTTIVY